MNEAGRRTYLLVDGENVDATLGTSILQRRPQPEERPRWDRVLSFSETQWEQPVTGLFFLAANSDLPLPFVQALLAIGFRPIPLSGRPDQKVVDIAIQRTLEALVDREADVMLVSHDGDFLPQVEALCGGGRRIAVMGFPEFRSRGFSNLAGRGVEFFDLETHVGAFNVSLPRVTVIPIDEFDPTAFL
ncbi:MAG: NYN domain-containing protein [Nocardioidaceae bacterium]